MKPQVYTLWDDLPDEIHDAQGLKDFPKSKTEPATSLSIEQQVNRYFRQGIINQAAKAGYEFGPNDDIPDDWIDITRDPNFDMADATQETLRIRDKIRAAKEIQNAENPPDSPNPETPVGDVENPSPPEPVE